jgi:hypothetical protein
MVWPTWSRGGSPDRVFQVRPGVLPPLTRVGELPGDAGFGTEAIGVLPCASGVVVSRRGVTSLYSHDLQEVLWRLPTAVPGGAALALTRSLYLNPAGSLIEVDIATGKAVRAQMNVIPYGIVVGFTTRSILMQGVDGDSGVLINIDRSNLRCGWRRQGLISSCTSARGYYLVRERQGDSRPLTCLDERSGEVVWSADFASVGARKKSQLLKLLRPHSPTSVAVVKDRVVVILSTGGIRVLDLASGDVVASHETNVIGGAHLISTDRAYLLQRTNLSEVDLGELKQIDRLEFDEAMLRASKKNDFAHPTSFWLTKDSVSFVSLAASFFVVERASHQIWREHDAAMVPMDESPVAWDDYVYLSCKSRMVLLCYRGTQGKSERRSRKSTSRGGAGVLDGG